MYKKISVLLLLFMVHNLHSQDSVNETIEETIQKRNQEFMDLYNSRNARGLAEDIFAQNPEIYPPNAPVITGNTDVVSGFWQAVMDMGIAKADIRTRTASLHGDIVIDTGDVSLYAADGNQLDEAKYMVIWVKEEGLWKIAKDIWNSKKSQTN